MRDSVYIGACVQLHQSVRKQSTRTSGAGVDQTDPARRNSPKRLKETGDEHSDILTLVQRERVARHLCSSLAALDANSKKKAISRRV